MATSGRRHHRGLLRHIHRVRHIRHMIQVGGMECVGLGSDLDGCKISFEIESAADMPLLINCLEKNGFTASQIDKICFENVLRLYKEVL